jgi:hypothetical protein
VILVGIAGHHLQSIYNKVTGVATVTCLTSIKVHASAAVKMPDKDYWKMVLHYLIFTSKNKVKNEKCRWTVRICDILVTQLNSADFLKFFDI